MIKFLAGILLIGLLVFLPAGSVAYWQGWLLMGVLFVPMFIAGIVMLVKSPDLLSKRLNAKEKERNNVYQKKYNHRKIFFQIRCQHDRS